jgi:hypothetical protein
LAIEDAGDEQFARLQQQVLDGIPGARDQRDALVDEVIAEAESLSARLPDLPALESWSSPRGRQTSPSVLQVALFGPDPETRSDQWASTFGGLVAC